MRLLIFELSDRILESDVVKDYKNCWIYLIAVMLVWYYVIVGDDKIKKLKVIRLIFNVSK